MIECFKSPRVRKCSPRPLTGMVLTVGVHSCAFCTRRAAVAGDHSRESELLKNHMQDLDLLAKMKEDNGALKKEKEHLRYETIEKRARTRDR